jgi:hypothetical protein
VESRDLAGVEKLTDGFDPLNLRPDASLNRTRLAALPGADERWVDRQAFELLSLQALERLASDLGLNELHAAGGVTWTIGAALARRDSTSVCAAGITEIFGRRLGHLVATLTNPVDRPEPVQEPWRTAYLQHWSRVEHVWLGGGIAAALGYRLAAAATRECTRLAGRPVSMEVAREADLLALLGAARSHPRPTTAGAVVLDFGHSAVKRGVVMLHEGVPVRVHLLPRIAISPERYSTGAVVDFVLQTIIDTFEQARQHDPTIDPQVLVSVASYLVNGRPAQTASLYAPLGLVGPQDLEGTLTSRLGRAVRLSFVHDGTAAAASLPGRGQNAVIMLGTALGVGFPPSEADAS